MRWQGKGKSEKTYTNEDVIIHVDIWNVPERENNSMNALRREQETGTGVGVGGEVKRTKMCCVHVLAPHNE